MRKRNKALPIIFVLLFLVSSLALLASAPQSAAQPKAKYANNLIKVKLSPQAITRSNLPTALYAETTSFGINELDQLLSVKGGTSVIRAHRKLKDQAWADKMGWDNWFLIRLDGRSSVEEAIASFKQNRFIEEAIPEYIAYTTAVPNDPLYAAQWGHNNTGQLPVYQGGSHSGPGVGTPGFDSRAQQAWDLPQGYGNPNIVIAIIDSGVDTAHEDLRLVAGYDYGDNDSNPMDNSAEPGHGTACAGIAAAKANNSIGVAGIAGGCSVMPLKVANSAGSMLFSSINNAITHAADNGAHIISMSLGANTTPASQPATETALLYARNNGVTSFAATANGNTGTVEYPANSQYVISVGAASPTGQRKSTTSSDGENWWGSNWGVNTQDARNAVDIMGPTILPTTDISGSAGYSSGNYDMYFNGTSCATPYVAGVAALVLSADPTLTPAQLRTVLTSTATDMTFDGGVGWDMYTGYGMVNAYAALLTLNPTLPSVFITAPAYGSVHDIGAIVEVNATATDNDGTITSVAFYLDDVLKHTDYSSPYTWSWNTASLTGGSYTIQAVATDNDFNTAQSSIIVSLLAPADEGFETGNFSAYPWVNNSAVPWTVQSAEKYSGTYAAKSGAITHNSQTEISITQNVSEAGNISFFYKVSSESGYDFLRFFIDDVQQGFWAGEVAWTQASYPVSTGLRTFTWRYTKDVSASSGSDCAWIDHIILPPTAIYYVPATNLSAVPGDRSVALSWTSPGGSVQSFDIYRNDSYLTNTSNTTYTDNTVSNGTNYSYYVVAVYAGGESEPTATINVIAGVGQEVILGTGTGVTGTQADSPINVYYKSRHGQAVYTKAELNAAGIFGPISITQIGFDVVGVPNQFLPNFVVRLKHTAAANVQNTQTADGMITVYGPVNYTPSTGWDMLTLNAPFLWNGTDNLVVDTAFSLIGSYNASGTLRFSTVTNGYRYWRSDTVDQTNVFSAGSTSTNRPNMKMIFAPRADDPEIMVSTTSLNFGNVRIYETATQNFTISNFGGGTLEGTITTSGEFSIAEAGTKSSAFAKNRSASRNVLNYSLGGGSNRSFTVTFDPESIGGSTGTISITHNTDGESKSIALSAIAYNPVPGTPNPTDTATNVSISQALSWVNDGTVTAVDVYVGDSELTLVKVADNQTSPLNSYTPATPWAFSTTYYWKVVAHNGSIYSGESAVYSFSTVYDPTVTVFPWTEDFETAGFPPNGWTTADLDGGGSFWESSTAYNHTPTGNKSARHSYSSAIPEGQDGWLITPSIVLPANANMELSFWNYNQFAGDMVYNGLMINTSPDPEDANWIEIWSAETVSTAWSQEQLSLKDYAGQTVYLAFVYRGYDADAWFLDDVEIHRIFDYPQDTPVTIGEGESSFTITISGGNANNALEGVIPPVNNSTFAPAHAFVLELLGNTSWTISIQTNAPWGAYYLNGGWIATVNAGGQIVFEIDASKNQTLPIILGDQDPTLPVTLSSFTAVYLSGRTVKLNWVAATETGVMGYYVLRGESDMLNEAVAISPLLEAANSSLEHSYEFKDNEAQPFTQYYYWLMSRDFNGSEGFFGPISVLTNNTQEDPAPVIPTVTKNLGNFPNPFNPNTNIRYSLASAETVKISIFNSRGQMVRQFSRDHADPGFFSIAFDGKDRSGRELSSGVYFYRFEAGKVQSAHRMMLLK